MSTCDVSEKSKHVIEANYMHVYNPHPLSLSHSLTKALSLKFISQCLINRKSAVTMLPTRKSVPRSSRQSIGPHEDLLTIVKRRRLQWYRHVSRSSGLAKTILPGTVKGGEDKADRGRGEKTTSGNGQA